MSNIRDWTSLNRPTIDVDYDQSLRLDIESQLSNPTNPAARAGGGLFSEGMEQAKKKGLRSTNTDPPRVAATWKQFLEDARIRRLIDERGQLISYSGSDIHAVIWFPIQGQGGVYELNSLQTVTISTFRDLIPGRVLGRASVNGYARGTRSVAGTLGMILAEQDAFTPFLPSIQVGGVLASHDEKPFYIDRIPPFWLILTAASEIERTTPPYIHAGSVVLENVRLFEIGLTLSVQDIYSETMYQYVAEDIQPFSSNNIKDMLREFQSVITLRRVAEQETVRSTYQRYREQVVSQQPVEKSPERKSQPVERKSQPVAPRADRRG